jgi:hypothetical protein
VFIRPTDAVRVPAPSASSVCASIVAMFASRRWLGRHLCTWLERWGSALVMEAECDDGSRLLIGLDPSCHVAMTVACPATDHWAVGLVVPDDLRDLVI